MCASVVAGVDAAPILETAKHDLDLVALAVEGSVVRDRHTPVRPGGDAGRDLAIGQSSAEPVCVITSIAEQGFGPGQRIKHQGSPFVIAHLPFAERHDQRAPVIVTDGVKLGVQATLGASDTAGNSPFLSKLAAVRCALR